MSKKHLREVETSIMPIGSTNIHKQINVPEFINKPSFICVFELKRVASRNESKTIILVRTSFQIPK